MKPMGKAERVGMSSERLARIDSFITAKYLDTGKLPCAQTLVWRRGELVHASALGKADMERDAPLREDAIFRIYSMTKPITSVAFMMLVEEGLVALDDPVHRYIPEWRNLGVYQAGIEGAYQTKKTAQPMRCIDLLRHTSGLTYGFQNRTNVDAHYRKLKVGDFATEGGLEGMMAQLARLPLEFSPGEAWNYSVSTDVLGYIVEKISGLPFDRFLQLKSGGGGLVSTADDYLRFTRMLLNAGELDGVRILSPKTIKLMTMNHLPGGRELVESSVSLFSEAVFEGLGFGLGFAMTIDQARTKTPGSLGEYFWGGMASTAFWVDPVEDLTCVFMTQLMPSNSYPIRRELRTLVYSAVTESSAP